jgi:hypothetical protein
MDYPAQPNPQDTFLSRLSFFFAALLLNSVIYQFAMVMTFFEGMKSMSVGLIVIYGVFILVAMYQRRLSAVSILTQLSLTFAFVLLGNDFARAAHVPPGIEYIRKYISFLILLAQFPVPLRLISRRCYLVNLWVVAGCFCIYLLVALYAGAVEFQAAERMGGFAALSSGLGRELWLNIAGESAVALALLVCLFVLSLSRRAEWPTDRKRRPRIPSKRRM